MNPNIFCGAATIEEYEVLIKLEPTIQDSEMLARGDGPLFMSIYDRLYVKNRCKKIDEYQSDADIVDAIFASKKSKEPKTEKPKLGLSAIIKKDTIIHTQTTVETRQNTSNGSDVLFIISLFK